MNLTKTEQQLLDCLNKDKENFNNTYSNVLLLIQKRDIELKKKILIRLNKCWTSDDDSDNLCKAEINAVMNASVDLNDSDVNDHGAFFKSIKIE